MSGRSRGFRKASTNLGSGSSNITGTGCCRSSIGGEDEPFVDTTITGGGEPIVGIEGVPEPIPLSLSSESVYGKVSYVFHPILG